MTRYKELFIRDGILWNILKGFTKKELSDVVRDWGFLSEPELSPITRLHTKVEQVKALCNACRVGFTVNLELELYTL